MSQLAPTKESFAINVGEVKIERGNTQIGEDKLTLYKYQEEVYRSRAELITIDAPTGAGKTLAMLLVAKKILEEGENALILYPTKALIKDQWESLKNLASKIGLNTEIIMVDADVLHKHAMNKGFKTHGEALLDLLSVGVPKVVLSNPDVVYYILRLYYKHGKSIFKRLFSVGFFGIDEIHLFWGVSLQILYTVLYLFSGRKRLLTTATHDPLLIELLKEYGNLKLVKAKVSEKGARIRYTLNLEVATLKAKGVLCEEGEAKQLAESALKALDEAETEKTPKVVCIVNSLAFSEKLAEAIRSNETDVSVINSLTPPEYRRMDAKIVVGTSAIEVGIDFDTEALIFEATDSASFIQRLGRVARKRRGRALCITPYYNYGKLQENLPSGGEVAYSQLENAVAKAYPRNPSYVHLFKTPYGAVAQMGITHALTHRLCRVKEKSILRRLKRLLKFSEELSPPPPMVWLKTFQSLLEGDHRKLRKTLAENSDLAKLFKVLGYKGQAVHALERLIAIAESFEKMGVRGPYSSLPAYVVLKRNGEGIYEALTSVSITDLEKLDFAYVRNCEEFEEEVGHRPSIDIEFPILIVRGISRRKNRIRIGISRFFEGEIFTLRKCEMQVISGDNELDSKISCILNGLPAYITTGRPADWRFTALRLNTKAEKWLVIGPDSIIQAWIDAERGEL